MEAYYVVRGTGTPISGGRNTVGALQKCLLLLAILVAAACQPLVEPVTPAPTTKTPSVGLTPSAIPQLAETPRVDWPLPPDKYILIERWKEVYEDYQKMAIDFPTYSFLPGTGVLSAPLSQEQITNLKIAYGRGQSRTGSAGMGAASRLFPVTELPFTDSDDSYTDAVLTLERVDADGVACLKRGPESIVLRPGEKWTTDIRRISADPGTPRLTLIRERISNFGIQDRSKIRPRIQ